MCSVTKKEGVKMGFSTSTKARAWVVTVNIENMKKAGLTEAEYKNPEHLATVFSGIWRNSGKGRKYGVAICESKDGLYHMHMALYGNLTTLGNVAKLLFNSHTEPQLGGKKQLKAYLEKTNKYAEKGEKVLFTSGLDELQEVKAKGGIFEQIGLLLDEGLKPAEIIEHNFAYRRYEKLIKSEYLARRIKNTPLIKDMHVEWHFGASGTGKSFEYIKLCEQYSPEDIYFCNDFENGGFDLYLESGAPSILFIDEFKGNMRFSTLLSILDHYSRAQTHARFLNTYNLWTTVVVTSVYPPDEAYNFMVDESNRRTDSFEQLLRRINKIVFHFKDVDEFKTVSVDGKDYKNKLQLMQLASDELARSAEEKANKCNIST